MKKYTHAWLSLKAMELLRARSGDFNEERNQRVKRLLRFMSRYPSTFVRGAWFPDTVIKDNTQGGHTWKYYVDPVDGREVRYRPPSHNNCLSLVQSELAARVSLVDRTSDLPDRCEALSQSIRDAILITNKVHSGDVIAFNDSQVAVLFLMLSHYVCDAHVPVHCDRRDFYTPSKVHPDLEAFWEYEIKKYYRVSTGTEQFDLDENQEWQQELVGLSGVRLSCVLPYVTEDVPPELPQRSRLRHGKDHESLSLQRECRTVLAVHIGRRNKLCSPCLVGYLGKMGTAGKGYPVIVMMRFAW